MAVPLFLLVHYWHKTWSLKTFLMLGMQNRLSKAMYLLYIFYSCLVFLSQICGKKKCNEHSIFYVMNNYYMYWTESRRKLSFSHILPYSHPRKVPLCLQSTYFLQQIQWLWCFQTSASCQFIHHRTQELSQRTGKPQERDWQRSRYKLKGVI